MARKKEYITTLYKRDDDTLKALGRTGYYDADMIKENFNQSDRRITNMCRDGYLVKEDTMRGTFYKLGDKGKDYVETTTNGRLGVDGLAGCCPSHEAPTKIHHSEALGSELLGRHHRTLAATTIDINKVLFMKKSHGLSLKIRLKHIYIFGISDMSTGIFCCGAHIEELHAVGLNSLFKLVGIDRFYRFLLCISSHAEP